jgi:hypothetical protein
VERDDEAAFFVLRPQAGLLHTRMAPGPAGLWCRNTPRGGVGAHAHGRLAVLFRWPHFSTAYLPTWMGWPVYCETLTVTPGVSWPPRTVTLSVLPNQSPWSTAPLPLASLQAKTL